MRITPTTPNSSELLLGEVVQPVPAGPCTARLPGAHVSLARVCALFAVPVCEFDAYGHPGPPLGAADATGAMMASVASAARLMRVMRVMLEPPCPQPDCASRRWTEMSVVALSYR